MKSDQTVVDLCYVLRNLPDIELLLHVGLKRNATENIDLLVGCNGGSINNLAFHVEELLKDRWPSGNFFQCDDSVRFHLPSGKGGIAIYDSALLSEQTKRWMEGGDLNGQHRSWSIGYWLPEALFGDLATAESLYDPRGIHAQIVKLIVPYPLILSRSISDLCLDEIKQKLPMIETLLERKCPIELNLCLSDIAKSILRLAFAQSHQYLRGFRSLAEQARHLNSSDFSLYEFALEISKMKILNPVEAKNLKDKIIRYL